MSIDQSVSKAVRQVEFNSRCSVNVSGSGGVSSVRKNVTCYKYGKKGHIQKDRTSKLTSSSGNPPKNPTNKIREWVTKKPVVSDTTNLETVSMILNNNNYKRFTSYNKGNCAWGFHWKDGHNELKISKVGNCLFVLLVLLPIRYFFLPHDHRL